MPFSPLQAPQLKLPFSTYDPGWLMVNGSEVIIVFPVGATGPGGSSGPP